MSTPISGNNILGLLSVPNSQGTSVSQGQTTSNQVGATPDASLSLSSMQVVASRAEVNVGLLAQEFAQAANSATTVDPSTGLSEVSATARTQLSSTLNTLLVQSGFSQSQADAATVASSMSTSYGTDYGSRTMSISTVAVNERSGSVAIEFDPTSGKLSISLAEGQVQSVTSTTEILRPAAALPSILPTSAGGLSAGGDQGGDSTDAKKKQNSAGSLDGSSDANSLLSGLIARLGQPTLHGSQEALQLLKGVTKGVQPGNANATTSAGDASSAGTTSTRSPSVDAPVSVTIGFTQALSISLLDLNGHGTTLFKRPDGDTAAMSFEPTHIEA